LSLRYLYIWHFLWDVTLINYVSHVVIMIKKSFKIRIRILFEYSIHTINIILWNNLFTSKRMTTNKLADFQFQVLSYYGIISVIVDKLGHPSIIRVFKRVLGAAHYAVGDTLNSKPINQSGAFAIHNSRNAVLDV